MRASVLLFVFGVFSFGCSDEPMGPDPPAPLYTAAERLSEVNVLAQSYNKGLQLLTVMSDQVTPGGLSACWHYQYVDTATPPATYWFHTYYGGVAFDGESALPTGAEALTHHWLNSDSAMYIAEQSGGSQFRSDNPECTISATVGEPVVPNPTTCWWVTYRSSRDNSKVLLVAIDAGTGKVTMKSQ